MKLIKIVLFLGCMALATQWVDGAVKETDTPGSGPCPGVNRAPWNDPNFFPLAIWSGSPKQYPALKAAGINIQCPIGVPKTRKELEPYENAGLKCLSYQTEATLRYVKENPNGFIIGWMYWDEPDLEKSPKSWPKYGWNTIEDLNALWPEHQKTLEKWKIHGPSIPPKQVIATYEEWRKNDSTRPVLVNFGPSVAWEGFPGRGMRSGKYGDYIEFLKGCDIASFDIYPATDAQKISGKLWYVPKGVENLRKWSEDKKTVWNCIECWKSVTADQIKTEVWMSLISGSRGILYFCAGAGELLDNPERLKGVTALNQQITALAPVLNSPTVQNGAEVKSTDAEVPVSVMIKKLGGITYVFSVAMREKETTATFKLKDGADAAAEVIGENRTIAIKDGRFEENFKGYEVHLYKIKP